MIRTICSLIFLAAATAATPAIAETLHLHSSYAVAGTNPNGSKYAGTADIKVVSDATFTIQWRIGGSTINGFGMRMNDALSATYMLNGQPGLVIYEVSKDGTLSGLWAIRGQDGNGTENLTPRD
jgi:hypothetical protein